MRVTFTFLVSVLLLSSCAFEIPDEATGQKKLGGTTCAGIRSGTPITTGSFDSVGGLYYKPAAASLYSLRCTASLITNQVILTAAHCIVDEQGISTDATLLYWGSTPNTAKLQGSAHTVHLGYDPANGDSLDIALIRLAAPVSGFTPNALRTGNISSNQTGTGVGFGFTEEANSSGVKRTGTMTFSRYANALDGRNNATVVNGFEVFNPGSNNQIACSGDSGGPVFVNGVIAGIVSYGSYIGGVTTANGICQNMQSVHYTSVPAHYSWVETELQRLTPGARLQTDTSSLCH